MRDTAGWVVVIGLLLAAVMWQQNPRPRELPEWSRPAPVPRATGPGTGAPKDPAAREFWGYGHGRGREDASSIGIDMYHGVSSMPAHVLGDLPDRAGAPRGTSPGEALTYLALHGGGLRDTPQIRQFRAQHNPMGEGYQLYQRLRSTPQRQRGAYAAALDGGYSRGFSEEKPKFERMMAERRQREHDRLQSHRRLTPQLLARTPDDGLEQAVMDYAINKIGNQWGRDYEVVTGLPHPIQLVFAMRRMKNEIDGDGLEHLLDEEESWQYAGLALEGYRLVGSRQRAAVMERAITAMKQEKARQAAFADEHLALDALDRQFYALDRTEPLEPLVANYIRQHLNQFVAD